LSALFKQETARMHHVPVDFPPLKGKDPNVPLDLSAALAAAYDNGAYDASIDYSKPPSPPLSPEDARWAGKLLRAKGAALRRLESLMQLVAQIRRMDWLTTRRTPLTRHEAALS
jgi:hypothetical protein